MVRLELADTWGTEPNNTPAPLPADPLRRDFGPGFQLQTARMTYGPVQDAFGHNGAGGSVHGRWPALGVGFSDCMSVMRDDQEIDPRPRALISALYRTVTG